MNDLSHNPRRLLRLLALALVLLLLLLPGSAQALEPATPLGSLNRQSWLMENGLPQNTIQALAQTPDGFLWLGTEAGLVRFDGYSFALFDHATPFVPGGRALPGNDIRALLAAPDGGLWIATGDGLVRLKNSQLTLYNTENGLPSNSVDALTLDDRGNLIAETDTGAALIEGNRAVPAAAVVEHLVARLPNGLMAQAANGIVTVMRNGHREAQYATGIELPGSRIQALLGDREGALWIGTNRGLARISGGKVQRFPASDPLGVSSILALLEDREGNIWAGTETSGLHVLRDQRFIGIGTREGLSSENTTALALCTGPDCGSSEGKLWVGTDGGGLNALRIAGGAAGEAAAYTVHFGVPSKVILALAAAPDGSLWIGTPNGLSRIRGSAIDAFTTAEGLPDNFVRSLLMDGDGSLWIGTRRGLAHWSFGEGGREITARHIYTHASGLAGDLIGPLARDGSGNLWIGTHNGLSRLHAGRMTTFTTTDGLQGNSITALAVERGTGQLLVGTEDKGWSLYNGQKFLPITAPNSTTSSVRAILDDGLGHLWLATEAGIARCDGLHGESGAASCTNWSEFTTSDGLRSRTTATVGQPTALRTPNGRLWFATPRGLTCIDPAHFSFNIVPPAVAIERVIIDDAPQPAASGLVVEAGHVHFQFDFAAMSFTAPQKVRYRYILEGYDKGWTEAGTRRTAEYTNIPPGKYTFRVQAANNDGVWNREGASFSFELRPRFYQTNWFYVAAALALILFLLLVILLIQRLRFERREREFRAVLGERNRIAREIHDTLAQGYVGISVQLEVLSELLRRNRAADAQQHLDTMRETVRQGLDDARQSIWALRSQDAGENTLPAHLGRLTEQAGSAENLESRFSVHGAYRPLKPETEQEILRIAQEAIQNVRLHAGARSLRVQLVYAPAEVTLEIRDDGRGFTLAGTGEIGSPPGHYGLTGMRERAQALGGRLELESTAGEGTSISLRLETKEIS